MKRGKSSWRAKHVIILLFLILVNIFNLYFIISSFSGITTGNAVSSTGFVALEVEALPEIEIFDPLNITYNFSIGEPFLLNLSVGASGIIDTWNYRLYDLRHNVWANSWTTFSPNTTFSAVRWGNRLFVEGIRGSNSDSENVTFFIEVPNSPPVLNDVPSQIFVCEADFLDHRFYATDVDEDNLTAGIAPSNPFFITQSSGIKQGLTRTNFSIDSGTLSKNNSGGVNGRYGNYSEVVSVVDMGVTPDSKQTSIIVIEINNRPFVEDVIVQTLLWNRGENSTFYKQVSYNDVETSLGHGSLSLSSNIWNSSGQLVSLFTINQSGVINFTANENVSVGVYDVEICIDDTGLVNPYPPIQTYCNQTGGSQRSCDNFSITVTNQNRAPTVVNFTPQNSSFNASGTDMIIFNVTNYDPDGTVPDVYWFVDGVLKEYDSGDLSEKFNYTFGCGVGGNHIFKAEITDGLLNDSVNWSVSVNNVACFADESSGGGGGGGGSGGFCLPKWGCNSWNLCQNAEASLGVGVLSGEDYRDIQDFCNDQGLDQASCGFQIRDCADLNICSINIGKPEGLQSCVYTENPTCNDKIKNCHGNECEFLVDCGGPCDACATCSDKKRNQGEEGVDCGGPCPWQCVPEVPLLKRNTTLYIFLGISFVLVVFIIIRLIRVLRYKKDIALESRRSI